MTEMVYGALPSQAREPVLPKWWQTLDKWTMASIVMLFLIGLMLGMAASPPLAAKNGFAPFHYVQKQVVFIVVMTLLIGRYGCLMAVLMLIGLTMV